MLICLHFTSCIPFVFHSLILQIDPYSDLATATLLGGTLSELPSATHSSEDEVTTDDPQADDVSTTMRESIWSFTTTARGATSEVEVRMDLLIS